MTIQDGLAPGKYKLRTADYLLLADAGAFGTHRTELIDGEVIVLSPQYRPHGIVKMELYDALRDALRTLRSPLRPVVEFSLDLAPDSMPDPDIMLTSEPRGAKAVPLASVALIIEVADATLADDLERKQQLYAGANIPEYWVADVNGRTIHRMWAACDNGYKETDEVAFGDLLTAATIPGLAIETSAL